MRENSKRDTRTETIWAIRDAHGLTAYEKLFLYTVEARGEFFESAKSASRSMGISPRTFATTAKSLAEKGLVTSVQRAGFPTRYTVNAGAVKRFMGSAPDADPPARGARVGMQEVQRRSASGASRRGTTKRTKERSTSMTKKRTLKRKAGP